MHSFFRYLGIGLIFLSMAMSSSLESSVVNPVRNGISNGVNAAASEETQVNIAADVNWDGVVNILDLIVVRNNLGKGPDLAKPPTCDVNQDGKINITDSIIVRNNL